MQICYMSYKPSRYKSNLTKKEKKVLVTISSAIAVCSYNVNLYAKELTTAEITNKVNGLGFELIGIAQLLIYWITSLCALVDIAKSVRKQDISGVVAIVIKYGAMMGAGYAMPWLWDIIKGLFS